MDYKAASLNFSDNFLEKSDKNIEFQYQKHLNKDRLRQNSDFFT